MPALAAAILLVTAPAEAEDDWCRYGDRTLLLLVDRTTEYDEEDRKDFAEGLERIFESLKMGDRFVMQTIEDAPQHSKTVFERCYPGCPRAGLWDWLRGSCQEMKARAGALGFKHDLARLGKALLEEPARFAHSAVGETLGTKGAEHRRRRHPVRHLFAFTDLLENTPAMPWPGILQRSGDAYVRDREMRDVLEGVDAQVFGVGRSHRADRKALDGRTMKKLKRFWNEAFGAMGAESGTITKQLGIGS